MVLNEMALQAARQFNNSLDRTQFYTKERMQAYQRNLLAPLLRHAKANVPFYATRLDPLFDKDGEISWDAWTDIPTVTRKDAQEADNQMFARNVPDNVGAIENGQTSGSTGRPLKFRTNSAMRLMAYAIGERIFDWHSIERTRAVAFIVDHTGKHPLPNGTQGDFWNITETEAVGFQLSLGYTVEEQAQWLSKTSAQVLVTYPSNAAAIVKHYRDSGLTAPFDTIICLGECLTVEVQKFLENGGNMKVINQFGASEIGPISAMCPMDHAIHHQFSEICLLENLDYASNTVLASGTGRMVATPFYNYAMPLIRYENFDYVETDDQLCSCGRTLQIINKIHGRQRNLFKFPDGKVRWPNVHFGEYKQFLPAQQVQFIQTTTSHIEILYVHDGSSREPDAEKMKTYMERKLNEKIDITLIRKTEIPKSLSGKFEDCISLVE